MKYDKNTIVKSELTEMSFQHLLLSWEEFWSIFVRDYNYSFEGGGGCSCLFLTEEAIPS